MTELRLNYVNWSIIPTLRRFDETTIRLIRWFDNYHHMAPFDYSRRFDDLNVPPTIRLIDESKFPIIQLLDDLTIPPFNYSTIRRYHSTIRRFDCWTIQLWTIWPYHHLTSRRFNDSTIPPFDSTDRLFDHSLIRLFDDTIIRLLRRLDDSTNRQYHLSTIRRYDD